MLTVLRSGRYVKHNLSLYTTLPSSSTSSTVMIPTGGSSTTIPQVYPPLYYPGYSFKFLSSSTKNTTVSNTTTSTTNSPSSPSSSSSSSSSTSDIINTLRKMYPPDSQFEVQRTKSLRGKSMGEYTFTFVKTELNYVSRDDLAQILEDYELTDEELDELFIALPRILNLAPVDKNDKFTFEYSNQRYWQDDPYEIHECLSEALKDYFKEQKLNVKKKNNDEQKKDDNNDSD